MRLSDYLKKTGTTQSAFADKIGRSVASVSRLASGEQRPDWDTIEAIERETGGKVTRKDFGPPIPKAEGAAA